MSSLGSRIVLTGILFFVMILGSLGIIFKSFLKPIIIVLRLFWGTSKSLAYNLRIIQL